MTIKLSVTTRDENSKLEALRANGQVPAVVYGPKQESVAISVNGKEFDKVRKEAGESTIIELEGLSETVEVLIQNVEFSSVKQDLLHADFYAVERGKEMTTSVVLEYIGEAPVEASKVGNITKVLHEVEVTCKPADLPSHIDVDLNGLTSLDDKILIKDLVLPTGVTVGADDEDPVVVVSEMKEEQDEESPELDMDAIEVEQKGKAEGAEESTTE
jgi:large subunit ribosomal protein L25